MKTTEDFKFFWSQAAAKGLLSSKAGDLMDMCDRIFATFLEELVTWAPEYQFSQGCHSDVSKFLIETEGFSGIVPKYIIENDKVTLSHYSVLYREGCVVLIHGSSNTNIDMMYGLSKTAESIETWQKLIDLYKIPENKEYIQNLGVLRYNRELGKLVSTKFEELKVQDDRIISEYTWNQELIDLISEKRGGSFIFHGEPGGGKSSYIRWLATQCPDKDFYMCGMSTLLLEGGIRYLSEFIIRKYSMKKRKPKEMVICIEDAEKLITDRNNSGTAAHTSELLNIIDGTAPGINKVKFIFTFNMKATKTDVALLRKGRLLKIVEFTKIKGDSLKKISEKFEIKPTPKEFENGLTVAEIVNYNYDNGYHGKNSIGF